VVKPQHHEPRDFRGDFPEVVVKPQQHEPLDFRGEFPRVGTVSPEPTDLIGTRLK
jgi:hypothetical protein